MTYNPKSPRFTPAHTYFSLILNITGCFSAANVFSSWESGKRSKLYLPHAVVQVQGKEQVVEAFRRF